MADEGTQPLSGAEAQLLEAQQAQQAAEAQTGTQPIARTAATQDPTVVDPRFDRDDLRQGKPAPAVRKGYMPRKIKVRRPRHLKGTPFKQKGAPASGAANEGAKTDEEAEEADMTDDEVEIEEEEVEPEEKEEKKSGGLLSKITGK